MMLKLQTFSGLNIIMILLWIGFLLFSLVCFLQGNTITIGLFTASMGTINGLLRMSQLLSYDIGRISQDYLKIQHYETFMKLPEIISSKNKQSLPAINTICFDRVFLPIRIPTGKYWIICHLRFPELQKPLLWGRTARVNRRSSSCSQNSIDRTVASFLLMEGI
jgi:hypothetical protein